MVFYDYPALGCLTVVITNDLEGPEEVIDLSAVEVGIAANALSLEELEPLLGTGFVELRVAAIDEDIGVLLDEILYYDSMGLLPSRSGEKGGAAG